MSKVKLAVGAASLLLFLVGIKKTFEIDEHAGISPATEPRKHSRGSDSTAAERGEAAAD